MPSISTSTVSTAEGTCTEVVVDGVRSVRCWWVGLGVSESVGGVGGVGWVGT